MYSAPIQQEGLPTPFITSVAYEPQTAGWSMGSGNIFQGISDLITGIGGLATQGIGTLAGIDLAYSRYDATRGTGLTFDQSLSQQNQQLMVYGALGIGALVLLTVLLKD